MENIGYYNGTFAPIEQLMIPALDRGVYFGDGVYEALRVERHRFFALGEHLSRFRASLDFLRIPFSMTDERLTAILQEAADRVDSDSQQLYFQVTRGTAIRTHAFPEAAEANLMIFSRGVALADLQEYRRVVVLPDTRWGHCNIKSLNLIPSVLAAQIAKQRGGVSQGRHRQRMFQLQFTPAQRWHIAHRACGRADFAGCYARAFSHACAKDRCSCGRNRLYAGGDGRRG
jgi:D-alanine transaminase